MRRIFNWIKKAVTFDSDVTVSGTLKSIGNAEFDGNLSVNGYSTFNGEAAFEDNVVFGGDASFDALDTSGAVVMIDLPTSDPTNAGQLWNDSGTLKVSAG